MNIRKHRKKSIAGVGVLASLITVLQFWNSIYPVICPLLPGKSAIICQTSGKISEALGPVLDSVQLDTEPDGGTNE